MATVPLQPPALFCFTKTDEWQKWKRNDVLTTTRISDDNRKKYSKIIEKLDEYFKVRHNIIFERARFNQRNQQQGNWLTIILRLCTSWHKDVNMAGCGNKR